jgi:cysteine desulfurase/selenocysteine lyase
MEYFGLPATTRASFGLYNTRAEVDALVGALGDAIRMLR